MKSLLPFQFRAVVCGALVLGASLPATAATHSNSGITSGILSWQEALLDKPAQPPMQEEAAKVQEPEQETDGATEPAAESDPVSPAPVAEPQPREVRLRLWDGTVITGDLGRESLHVQTRFGRLEVPVRDIVLLTPGLKSLPELKARIDLAVEQLGDRDFQVRQRALQELGTMGHPLLEYLGAATDGGSAERKKNLQAILEQLQDDRATAEEEDPESVLASALTLEDSVTTAEFTIVGTIEEQEFRVQTRFGELQVRLADVRQADRTWLRQNRVVQKSVEVDARDFFQTTPAETGIRISRGDRIRIRATGSVAWVSWGNITSSPEGITNQGQWESMNCGMLAARIGKKGPYLPIGSEESFVAEQDGELVLAIAMNEGLAGQQGYEWTGNYKVKISVVGGPEK